MKGKKERGEREKERRKKEEKEKKMRRKKKKSPTGGLELVTFYSKADSLPRSSS